MSLKTGVLTQLNNALPDPSHTRTLLPPAPSAPTSTVAFSSHAGSKVTSQKLCPSPGPPLTVSSLYIQFAFQDFLYRAPTIRIPKLSCVNLWMPPSLGREETHEGRASCLTHSCTSGPQSLFVEGRREERAKPRTIAHTPLPETKISNNRQELLRPCIPDGPLS